MWYRICKADACKWCQSLSGSGDTYRDISFARHNNCKCAIINEELNTIDTGTKKGIWERGKFSDTADDEIKRLFKNAKNETNINLKGSPKILKDIAKILGKDNIRGIDLENGYIISKNKGYYHSSLANMDKSLLAPNIKQLESLLSRYSFMKELPNFELSLTCIPETKDYIAVFNGKSINLHPNYFADKKTISNITKNAMNDGYFVKIPSNKQNIYTITHEFAHALQYNISKKNKKSERKLARRMRANIKKDIAKQLGINDWRIINETNFLSQYSIDPIKDLKMGKNAKYEFFAEIFSKYTLTNDNEVINKALYNELKKQGVIK